MYGFVRSRRNVVRQIYAAPSVVHMCAILLCREREEQGDQIGRLFRSLGDGLGTLGRY
jgi:hypothetical protein